MNKTILLSISAFLVGLAVASAVFFFKPGIFGAAIVSPKILSLPPAQVEKLLLYASIKDGKISGKFFNQNPDIVVTQITVEAVPKDEKNFFNKFTPRLFNVVAVAQPNSMSGEFQVETGALNPEFHDLKVTNGQGSYVQ